MKKALKFLIALLLGGWLFHYVLLQAGWEVLRDAVSLFFGWQGFFILLITFLIVFVGTFRWREVLRAEGERVSFLRTMRYLVKGFTVDFLTPFSLFGGEALRIFLMKDEVGVRKSASSAVIDKIMDVTTHFFFLILGLLLFFMYGLSFQHIVLVYGVIAALILFLLLFFFYFRVLRGQSILRLFFYLFNRSFPETGNGKTLFEVEERVIDFFSTKKRDMIKGMVLSFLRHFLLLFRTFLIIFFLIGRAEPGGAIVAYGLTIISMLLPLPAALGGLEAISAFGFSVIGFGFGAGTAYAITVRGADLFICIFGVLLLLRFFFKRMTDD